MRSRSSHIKVRFNIELLKILNNFRKHVFLIVVKSSALLTHSMLLVSFQTSRRKTFSGGTFLRIWSHKLQKSFMKNFLFCAVKETSFIKLVKNWFQQKQLWYFFGFFEVLKNYFWEQFLLHEICSETCQTSKIILLQKYLTTFR